MACAPSWRSIPAAKSDRNDSPMGGGVAGMGVILHVLSAGSRGGKAARQNVVEYGKVDRCHGAVPRLARPTPRAGSVKQPTGDGPCLADTFGGVGCMRITGLSTGQ